MAKRKAVEPSEDKESTKRRQVTLPEDVARLTGAVASLLGVSRAAYIADRLREATKRDLDEWKATNLGTQ